MVNFPEVGEGEVISCVEILGKEGSSDSFDFTNKENNSESNPQPKMDKPKSVLVQEQNLRNSQNVKHMFNMKNVLVVEAVLFIGWNYGQKKLIEQSVTLINMKVKNVWKILLEKNAYKLLFLDHFGILGKYIQIQLPNFIL